MMHARMHAHLHAVIFVLVDVLHSWNTFLRVFFFLFWNASCLETAGAFWGLRFKHFWKGAEQLWLQSQFGLMTWILESSCSSSFLPVLGEATGFAGGPLKMTPGWFIPRLLAISIHTWVDECLRAPSLCLGLSLAQSQTLSLVSSTPGAWTTWTDGQGHFADWSLSLVGGVNTG